MKKHRIVIDITSLVSVSFISGIQRVVREVITRMAAKRSCEEIEFCLIAYRLRKRRYCSVPVQGFLDFYQNHTATAPVLAPGAPFSFDDLGPDDIFFDIDSVWNNRMRRSFLLPILKRQGVKIAVHIYDIIPAIFPQYCDGLTTMRFMDYLGAHLQYADLVISNTQRTIHDLADLSARIGTQPVQSVCVPLGVNALKQDAGEEKLEQVDRAALGMAGSMYLLMVGTIEPRKNHASILDAYENVLRKEGFNLIIAGREGWNVEGLMTRIRKMQREDDRFLYLEHANDDTVNYLYEHAFFTVFPTQYEGFGLPIIESFLHGTPVIASDIDVLHEVGDDFCDYYPINDDTNLLHILLYYKKNPTSYMLRKNQLKSYVPVSWDQAESQMWAELQRLVES